MPKITPGLLGLLAAGLAATMAVSACGGGSSGDDASGPPSGTITVLTNRTDLKQDGTLAKYAAAFTKLNPKVTVKFQAITDYAGEVKTRMNTDNYGDVLLIPPAVSRTDYPKFFEPLGDATDLSKKYNWIATTTTDGTLSGKAYGLATFGNANGFVYNKRIWKQAGVTSVPTSPDQFLSDLSDVKSKTSAIPYYTNYKDGWPVQGWSGALGSPNCDTNANTDLATDKTPFDTSKDAGSAYSLLYNVVNRKLSEPDPTTTNWENSKALLATGKVSSMWLGSWALSQMKAAATTAKTDPADIGFMPWPTQKDGKFCSVTGPDYNQAINIHSKHKAAARAWIDWFTDKSGFAADNGALSPVKGAAMPDSLSDYTAAGVTYIELNQAKAGTVSQIDNQSEVGFFSGPNTAQRIVDVARGAAKGDLTSVLNDLNKKWADGIDTVG